MSIATTVNRLGIRSRPFIEPKSWTYCIRRTSVSVATSTSNESLNGYWKSSFLPRSSTIQYQGGSWTSPHDIVSRNAFAKDHAHLWTLLEACIDSNNMSRAESVLVGLSQLATETDITLAVNNYLLRLCELNDKSPTVGQLWIRRISPQIPLFRHNSVTDAILLKNIYTSGNKDELKHFIDNYEKHSGIKRKSISELLGHVEVLGLEALKDIVQTCHVPLSSVNEKYRDYIVASNDLNAETSIDGDKEETKNQTVSDDEMADLEYNLKKGVEEIRPTGTIGLSAIRHSLSGLVYQKEEDMFWDSVVPLLQDKDIEKGNYLDFREISRRIEDPKKLKEFNSKLNALNEKRQRNLEARGIEGAREKWRAVFEKRKKMANHQSRMTKNQRGEGIVGLKALDTLLWEWNEAMQPLIEEEFERVQKLLQYSSPGDVPTELRKQMQTMNISFADRFEYGPYLLLVKPEILSPITILEVLRLNSTGGVSEGMRTARAVLSVGKTVEREYRARLLKEKENASLKGVQEVGNEKVAAAKAAGAIRDAVLYSDLNSKTTSWPVSVRAKIGSLLISLLLQVAKVTINGTDPLTGVTVKGKAPAFYHSYQYKNGSRTGVLKIHKTLTKHLSGEAISSVIQPQQLPMLVKPRPWVAYNKGGYLYSSNRVMRSKDSPEQVAYLKAASDQGKLDKFFKALNILGETAWTINTSVFPVILKVWNAGKTFLSIPADVDSTPEFPAAPPRDCDPTVRRDWLRECRKLANENMALFSQRCDANYKLEIARAYMGERFYFPHNVDFRGRAYPLPPHLNHLGNDMSRALLTFWEAKPLGENGLDWLKIHCANLYGFSKSSLDERKKFVDEHMDDILDSANHPLDGKRWWAKSESPWQTLAVCMELKNALASGDPASYKCSLPIHQDGSCNGLQHYAALGGDIEGAAEVNLIPSDQPQDVYTRVLEIVRQSVEKDMESSVKSVKADAELVIDHLSRKLIKQTVMTHVYGVTFAGARNQIANKLGSVEAVRTDQVYKGSIYLARKVLDAVRSLFEGAHLIQDWLGESAIRISKSVRLDLGVPTRGNKKKSSNMGKLDCMSSVIWTTPMGLPIVQPYRQDTKKQVQTALQSVFITDPYALRGVNTRKQRTAFPPNFVHSLDATHMLLSAIGCGEKGITFAAVHDSYWTHAGDVDRMNEILRESFISLHQVDLIEQLRLEFQKRYNGLLQFSAIPYDCEVGEKIRKVQEEHAIRIYGHVRKLTMADQLEIEQLRLQRLERGKPDDIETPVSVIEKVPLDELESLLINTTEEMKARGLASKTVSNQVFRSTEYNASSVEEKEMADTEIKDEDETSQSNTAAIDDLGTASSKVMGVFVPLRISKIPPKGDFDIQQVRNSKYFFS